MGSKIWKQAQAKNQSQINPTEKEEMSIPDPNPYPAQTEREYMICTSSFYWDGDISGLARKWQISVPELQRILRGPYGPGSYNGS